MTLWQAGGARAVPIQCDLPAAEIARRFATVNGLLIPGGGQPLFPGHCYYDAALQLLRLTIEAAEAGDYFPVHATCLGFEVMAVQLSHNLSLLSTFDALNLPSSIQPTELSTSGQSRLWSYLAPSVRANLRRDPISMQNHAFGVSLEAFQGSPNLRRLFDVVATSTDRLGREYVSMVEAKSYGLFGFQSHPEKPAFEWAPTLDIPHDPDAVEATLSLARFFGSEARRSRHKARSRAAEEELLIYNWAPVYTGKLRRSGAKESMFEQCYFFPPTEAVRLPDIDNSTVSTVQLHVNS